MSRTPKRNHKSDHKSDPKTRTICARVPEELYQAINSVVAGERKASPFKTYEAADAIRELLATGLELRKQKT